MWKLLDEEGKEPYESEAKRLKQQFEIDHPELCETPAKKAKKEKSEKKRKPEESDGKRERREEEERARREAKKKKKQEASRPEATKDEVTDFLDQLDEAIKDDDAAGAVTVMRKLRQFKISTTVMMEVI